MNDMMIDLETLGLRPGSVFHEIAAASFDIRTGQVGQTFYGQITIEDAWLHGLTSDPETRQWWEAKGGPRQDEAAPFRCVLDRFLDFYSDNLPERVWAMGSDFDFPILAHGFEAARMDRPWEYWRQRDARTAWDLAFPGRRRDPAAHVALDDALAQVGDLRAALRELCSPLVS